MPAFELTGRAAAPVEDVWKLLFDPTRFPEWWTGIETVRTDGPSDYTVWPDGWPDYPMPQRLRTDRSHGRVVVSCQVSDIDFVWQLAEDGDGTLINVRVVLPEAEARREADQRAAITDSLRRLSTLAHAEP